MVKRLIAILFFVATPLLATNPHSEPEFLRAYVRTLILINEANVPFENMPHLETGSREQIAAFAGASRIARATLTKAIDEIGPFTGSMKKRIAESAKVITSAIDTRRKLCDGWMATYEEMSKPDGKPEEIAKQVVALRGDIDKAGQAIGDSAIAAVWGVIEVDSIGRPQQWAVTWGERRAAQRQLKEAFGKDIDRGPKPRQNYVQMAASAFCRFLGEPGFEFLPSTGKFQGRH
jgi:hypothetical protein